jgi:hypothetical protein
MNWLDAFSKKQTPEKISVLFKILILLQMLSYVRHFDQTFYTKEGKWCLHGEVEYALSDPQRTWNNDFHFSEDVEGAYKTLDLRFAFSTFQEWLNVYSISFFILDFLKWCIVIFIFWQLSKAMSDMKGFNFRKKKTGEINFKLFTDDGVKRWRLAAIAILFIPLLDEITKLIFVNFAGSLSSAGSFTKGSTSYIIGFTLGKWLPYVYPTIILLGISEIFRYGQQLKEETELTV